MLRLFKLVFVLLLVNNLFAASHDFDFDLIKKGTEDNNTLLIVGGIQGDEPGGFMAASLIATHYEITKGSVWVVPNLNFYSIIKRNRGPFGDMNRKFAHLPENDPDYDLVEKIKAHIKNEKVKLVLNLHDGSGFYRPNYKDSSHSPIKWGQSSIIDQAKIDVPLYGNLEEISARVCESINTRLIKDEHLYHVKNTETRMGDKEMAKTLTYFAINNNKPAFGNEASKALPVHERAYYHLLAIEEYMKVMGIEFKRRFEFEPIALKHVIDHDIYISFYDEKIRLPLSQIRNYLRYFPVKKDGNLEFTPSNPLMTIVKSGKTYTIYYGNRRLAHLSPDYLELDDTETNVKLKIDGEEKSVKFGSLVDVDENFFVYPNDYRVNVIGYLHKDRKDESGLDIHKSQVMERFSIDKNGQIYRVEFYKEKKFAGMVLVKFKKKDENFSVAVDEPLKLSKKSSLVLN